MNEQHKFIGKNITLKRDWLSQFHISSDALSLFGLIDYVEGVDYEIEDGDGIRTKILDSRHILMCSFIIDLL